MISSALKKVKITMGTGIAAAIPIILGANGYDWRTTIERKYFSEKFFENYTFDESRDVYIIKPAVLLDNYQSFITEFYDCIGEDFDAENTLLPCVDTYADFETAFDRDERKGSLPYLRNYDRMFDFSGGESKKYWVFYMGSYKAFLETDCTLLHFERTLTRAMKNPLADMVKFGIFG